MAFSQRPTHLYPADPADHPGHSVGLHSQRGEASHRAGAGGGRGGEPNTVQRALAELEGTGLLHTQRTAGRFVTEDTAVIQSAKEDLARSRTREYLESMAQLGYDRQRVKALLEEWKEE